MLMPKQLEQTTVCDFTLSIVSPNGFYKDGLGIKSSCITKNQCSGW